MSFSSGSGDLFNMHKDEDDNSPYSEEVTAPIL